MCGLVGVFSSNITQKHKDVLKDLLYLDTFRGRDSTGVAMLRANTDTEVFKATIPGYDFVESERFQSKLRFTDFCWIGHNRFGTVGKNTKQNAHPFVIEDEDGGPMIVGAHNGTLKNRHILPDYLAFGTDSEALFHAIACTSVEEVIPQVEGAWALTWYDHVAEEMRFLRNKERPLFYAWEKGKKTMIWASEMWMLRVATSRHGVELEDDKVYTFLEDHLYSVPVPIKMNEILVLNSKGGLVGKETPTFFRGRVPIGGQQTSQSQETGPVNLLTYRQLQHNRPKESTTPTSTTPSGTTNSAAGEKPQTTNVISLPKPSGGDITGLRYKGYKGILLSKQALDRAIENGCAWCELEYININDRFAWLGDNEPVCEKCITGEHLESVIPVTVTKH